MQLLKSEDMTFEQPFPLKESGHNSTLTCRFTLKVCNTMKWRSTLGHSLFEQATLQWMLLLNGEYIKKIRLAGICTLSTVILAQCSNQLS